MNERDIIIDPIITHNNYLIEVAPDEFVNVTQLWKEYKRIVKDNKDLQNRIDKAIKYIKSYKTDYSPYELSDYNIRQILEILEDKEVE